MRTLVFALFVAGCSGSSTKTGPMGPADADGDGFDAGVDCDDTQAMVYPGAFDVWYDGLDQDCAGNDDFDQDGDGAESNDYGGDDCNDLNPAVYPLATEIPYDGVDEDCDPSTVDDDLDGDGFLLAHDCDDGDPTVYDGAPEILDDGVDQDCDGVVDAAPWGYADLTFLNPLRPVLGVTDDYVVLSVVAFDAQQASWPELTDLITPGLLITLDLHGVNGAPLAEDAVAWYGMADEDPIASGDLEVRGSEAYFGTTYHSTNNDRGYLVARPRTWMGPGIGWFQEPASYFGDQQLTWSATDLRLDPDGTPWVCGADGDSIGYMHGDATVASPGANLDGVDAARGCFWTADRAFTTLSSTGAATTWDVDDAGLAAPVVSADQPLASGTWTSGHERGGLALVIANAGGFDTIDAAGAVTHQYDQYQFQDADLATDGGSTWVAGVVDRGSGNEVLLANDGIERWFEVHQGTRVLEASGVAIALTSDRVVVAVSALDVDQTGRDLVGWVFYPR